MESPWWTEKNDIDFEADRLKCAMRRGPLGAWCGYVGIPTEHPWFGLPYNSLIKPTKDMLGPRGINDFGPIDLLCAALSSKDIEQEMSISLALRVHGGVTYSEAYKPYSEPDGLWWFGFDCAHSGDLVPEMEKYNRSNNSIYRNQDYVIAECQSLASQLAKLL